jgi:hypothetical protein
VGGGWVDDVVWWEWGGGAVRIGILERRVTPWRLVFLERLTGVT